jgi:hypothetical protein
MNALATRPLGEFLEEGDGRRPDVVAPILVSGINWLAAPPGNGKSLLACELALTKATGLSRAGFSAEPGPVLFVSADMGPDTTRDYLRPLVYPGREQGLVDLHIATPHGLLLDDIGGAEALLTAVRDVNAELVILDYFANFLETDGFSNKELRPVLDVLAEIRDVCRVPILVIDQNRKTTGQKATDGPPIDNLYGGRAKGAIADRVVFMSKDAGSGVFTLKGAKARGAGFAEINLTYDEFDGWQRQDAAAYRPTPSEDTVFACIASASNLRPRTIKEIVNLTGLSKRAVQGALNALRYHGKVVEAQKVGREKTYKCATVQEGATQGEMHVSPKGASAQSPSKGDCTPERLPPDDGVEAVVRRFGFGAERSKALTAYAAMVPEAATSGRTEP